MQLYSWPSSRALRFLWAQNINMKEEEIICELCHKYTNSDKYTLSMNRAEFLLVFEIQ